MKQNRYCFGLGTIGRDMVYTMISMYLMFYLTEVLQLSDATLAGATAIMAGMRLWDAVNDPLMGMLVDNTRTRWGKFKPWIIGGAIPAALLTILFFTDPGLTGRRWLLYFFVVYVVWEITYTEIGRASCRERV